jgi:phasin family protein
MPEAEAPKMETLFAGTEKMTAMFGDLAGTTKANLEAFMASAQVATKGSSDAAALVAASTKAAFERTFELTKAATTAGSVQALVELQAEYAKTSVETALKDMNELTSIMTTTAKDAIKPLSDRASAAMATLQGAAA